MIALIVAVANGNVIGNKGQMPWERIPLDLRRFAALTKGCPLAMGRRTLMSVERIFPNGEIFPGRTSFVLTSEPRKVQPFKNCVAIQDTGLVFELAKKECVCIIGGGIVYQQFINKADIAYITRINADFEGDAFFPPFSTDWERLSFEPACDSGYNLSFETWARGYKRHPILPEEITKFSLINTRPAEFVTRLC